MATTTGQVMDDNFEGDEALAGHPTADLEALDAKLVRALGDEGAEDEEDDDLGWDDGSLEGVHEMIGAALVARGARPAPPARHLTLVR